MKLTKEIKDKIDNYFANISSEELFAILIDKYNFEEVTFEIENEKFSTIKRSDYLSDKSSINTQDMEKDFYNFSLAA